MVTASNGMEDNYLGCFGPMLPCWLQEGAVDPSCRCRHPFLHLEPLRSLRDPEGAIVDGSHLAGEAINGHDSLTYSKIMNLLSQHSMSLHGQSLMLSLLTKGSHLRSFLVVTVSMLDAPHLQELEQLTNFSSGATAAD